MKLLGRTFAILFAALLVAGATYALGGGSLTGGTTSNSSGTAIVQTGGPPAGNVAAREGHGQGGDREGGGVFGALEIGKNVAMIMIIVALVSGSTALVRRIWPGTCEQEPPAASAN